MDRVTARVAIWVALAARETRPPPPSDASSPTSRRAIRSVEGAPTLAQALCWWLTNPAHHQRMVTQYIQNDLLEGAIVVGAKKMTSHTLPGFVRHRPRRRGRRGRTALPNWMP